ncbi:hypothetical protein PAMP_005848 [Pampus punctatissimus]
MEWSPAVMWTCLLGAALTLVLPPALSITTSQTVPRPPRLINCVFLNRANVTCRWDAGDILVTHYTLQVQMMPGFVLIFMRMRRCVELSLLQQTTNSSLKTFTCTTSGLSCTAGISSSSVRSIFCITITAHGYSQDILSEPRCQRGRIEVMLPPATLNSVKPVRGRPRCLNVIWSRTLSAFPVSKSEVKAGVLNSQIEFTSQGQFDVQVKNVTVKDYSFTVCLFRPDTSYIIRLRHRYQGPESSWSPWSNACQGRTGEDEPPPPSQITASPLDDNNLDVHWTAPVDPSVSGFVVEWFAVREKNSSIQHWEKLNSSRTALVITEGVKPMERYSISVKALYGKQGAGQKRTLHIYTRQGVPSAGPTLEVQQISGNTIELRWSPVPVELCHGFIRSYTLYYTTANQPTGSSEEISMVICAVFPLLLTCLVLVLMACLAQNKSSLANWTPKNTLENMKQPAVPEASDIKYSEVILLSKSDLHDSDPDQDFSYQGICKFQTYSSHQYSPLPVSVAQTPQNTPKFNNEYTRSSTRAKTTSTADLSSSPTIYSNVLFSQIHQTLPATILCPSNPKTNVWQQSTVSVNDNKLQPGGDIEHGVASDSPTSQTDELNSFFLKQYHSSVSFPDFNKVFHSSVLLSHPVEVTSPQHCFSRSHFNSVPSHLPDALAHPDSCSDTSATTSSPFLYSVFVDFSYCPVECGPYISPNT